MVTLRLINRRPSQCRQGCADDHDPCFSFYPLEKNAAIILHGETVKEESGPILVQDTSAAAEKRANTESARAVSKALSTATLWNTGDAVFGPEPFRGGPSISICRPPESFQ